MFRPFRMAFFALLVAVLGVYFSLDGESNFWYESIHFLIVILSIAHIAKAQSFNLGVSFSFFALFFFGLIPMFEYKLRITYQGLAVPRDESYTAAAALALLASLCFYLGYSLRRALPAKLSTLVEMSFVSRLVRQLSFGVLVIAIFILAFSIAAFHGFDPRALFFRGSGEEIESTAFGYSLTNYFARPLLFNLVLLALLNRRHRTPLFDPRLFLLLGLALMFVSPLGIPRTLAGALYIPLVVLVFMPKLVAKYSMLCIVIGGMFIAAPVADIFRQVIQPGDGINLLANFNFDYFFAGHFDAFHNLVQVVELNFTSDGWQIIGALLFWVPRSVWPEKPVGTSFDFAEFAGLRAGNISFPLIGDLYVDFGVFGVILGMLALGVLYKAVDNYLTRPRAPGSLSSYVLSIAHLELALLGVYLLRGAFLSSFAFTIGVATTLAVINVGAQVIGGAKRERLSQPSSA